MCVRFSCLIFLDWILVKLLLAINIKFVACFSSVLDHHTFHGLPAKEGRIIYFSNIYKDMSNYMTHK